jgi:hypothetical protein
MLTWRVGCCHLSGLLCSFQAAGPDEDPRIDAQSNQRARWLIGAGGFGRSRSDLWCHHAVSRPRKPKESLMCRPRRRDGCRARGAVSSCSFSQSQPLCSIGGTTSPSRPVLIRSAARSGRQGWPARATAGGGLALPERARCYSAAGRDPRCGWRAHGRLTPKPVQPSRQGCGTPHRAPSRPRRSGPACWPAPPPRR